MATANLPRSHSDAVWGVSEDPMTNVVDVYVSRRRRGLPTVRQRLHAREAERAGLDGGNTMTKLQHRLRKGAGTLVLGLLCALAVPYQPAGAEQVVSGHRMLS